MAMDEPVKNSADENKPVTVADADKLAQCEKQRDEYLAGWQRAKADFLNYKKDEIKRLEEMLRYVQEDLLLDFINVLDSFDLGLTALEKAGPVEKGVYMIRTQIEDALKKRGVSKIPIRVGDIYNPSLAEAIAEVDPPAGGAIPPGSIIAEIEPGYKLGDKIIRPARVKVSKDQKTS